MTLMRGNELAPLRSLALSFPCPVLTVVLHCIYLEAAFLSWAEFMSLAFFSGSGVVGVDVDDLSFSRCLLVLERSPCLGEAALSSTSLLLGVESCFLQEAFGVVEEFFEVFFVGSHGSSLS